MWGKGWEELIALLAAHKRAHPDEPVIVDGYGDGAALDWVSAAGSSSLPFHLHQCQSHASVSAHVAHGEAVCC